MQFKRRRIQNLRQEKRVFRGNKSLAKSFIRYPLPDAVSILREALVYKNIPQDLRGVQECYEKGCLHSEAPQIGVASCVVLFPFLFAMDND